MNNEFTASSQKYDAVVIGVSAGGLNALTTLLPKLPNDFPMPVIIVQHRASDSDNFLIEHLGRLSNLQVKEAEVGELAQAGFIYLAPANYHLLIERNRHFSLNVDPPVSYAIPSVDVLFYSAARCFGEQLIGVVLTGANSDGTQGLKEIKQLGGLTIVQQPETAQERYMPDAAIAETKVDYVLPLLQIGQLLTALAEGGVE
ncbi:chemotaxis protein CheB [Psychrobium sp. 1_MG-2023]|uniref:chemotaxis protein CheB n=1 Tax=Psychrobium sp. 1_MG-2023 TaxID=3062624 RepID=UPI000C331E66|nr:chemotaxis protein CheB [Psychrobium sp. 1_MG-2023]MDP2560907.1 chemotaxis protein CheB [Psychrobium sp. 1_MG-2023]PKF55981.1 chemotaxis protein CheB [Alteromonadales bacterium alter-6D02]